MNLAVIFIVKEWLLWFPAILSGWVCVNIGLVFLISLKKNIFRVSYLAPFTIYLCTCKRWVIRSCLYQELIKLQRKIIRDECLYLPRNVKTKIMNDKWIIRKSSDIEWILGTFEMWNVLSCILYVSSLSILFYLSLLCLCNCINSFGCILESCWYKRSKPEVF